MSEFAAVVANWNGEAFIERAVGSVLAAARASGVAIETMVYDDASTDRSPELVARSFPSVRLERGSENVGFGEAVNRAMRLASARRVFLLNNDLALQTDFFARLIATLREQGSDPPFAIGAMTRDWQDGSVNHGGQREVWRGGMLEQEGFEAETAVSADFFQAGACLIDRERFLELGGFSPLFFPGYWEDYDIARQARGRGWGILYEPRAVALHLGRGSMRRKLGTHGVSLALRRNHLLYNWLNLEKGKIAEHLLNLPGRALRDRPEGEDASWSRAFFGALGRLPGALAERRRRLSA